MIIRCGDTDKYAENPGHSGRSLKSKVSSQCPPDSQHHPLCLESRGRTGRFQMATRHDGLRGHGTPKIHEDWQGSTRIYEDLPRSHPLRLESRGMPDDFRWQLGTTTCMAMGPLCYNAFMKVLILYSYLYTSSVFIKGICGWRHRSIYEYCYSHDH